MRRSHNSMEIELISVVGVQSYTIWDSYNFISRLSFAVWVNIFSLIVCDTCSFQLYYFHMPIRDKKRICYIIIACIFMNKMSYSYNILELYYHANRDVVHHEIDRAKKKNIYIYYYFDDHY